FPQIGSRPIAEIDAPELLDVIRKIEQRGVLETARRLRQSCGQIFRYAIVTGRAKHDPSAGLRGALDAPSRKRGHKAMSRDELPTSVAPFNAFYGAPRTRFFLRLIFFLFGRTGELRAPRWSELKNLKGKKPPLWRIPAERMKMKREHVIPLAPQVV